MSTKPKPKPTHPERTIVVTPAVTPQTRPQQLSTELVPATASTVTQPRKSWTDWRRWWQRPTTYGSHVITSEEMLQELAQQVQAIIVEVNQRGGSGKTTGACSTAVMLGEVTRQSIVVIDGNRALGNTASRLGVESGATVRTAAGVFGDSFTHSDICRLLGSHPRLGNVRCIMSDDAAVRSVLPELAEDQFALLIANCKKAAHSVLVDLGGTLEGPYLRAAMTMADVVRINFVPWQENSAIDALDTLRHLQAYWPDKADRALVVVNGYRGQEDEQRVATAYSEFFFGTPDRPNQILLVPYDQAFEPLRPMDGSPLQPINVLDPKNFSASTYRAMLRRDIATLKAAAAAQADRDVIPAPRHPDEEIQ